jgi:hypothetical protein
MTVAVIGHPFAPIGMGEQMRAGVKSLLAAHVDVEVIDAYRHASRGDRDHRRLIQDLEVEACTSKVRIFHINGDEVAPVLRHMQISKLNFTAGYNIIVPAWELPTYPAVWVDALNSFDEVWAISNFVSDSLNAASVENHFIGQSAEVPPRNFLPRRYFGIRDSAFVFLHFFDLSSYASRKNPEAVLQMFEGLRERRPFSDLQLVVKIKSASDHVTEWSEMIKSRIGDVVIISDVLSTFETHSLICAADCFVSLHRSEGFGRAPAEAMFLGKLVMATGWSGNMDFMSRDSALLVDFELQDVAHGEYPESAGQQWAYPDVDHAISLALSVVDDPPAARRIAENGRHHVRHVCSHRAVGLRALDRLETISSALDQPV